MNKINNSLLCGMRDETKNLNFQERKIMKWYNDMTEQEKQSFKKVVAVCVAGAILILLIPMIWHLIL